MSFAAGQLHGAIEDVHGDTVLLALAIDDVMNSHIDLSPLLSGAWPDAKYIILNDEQVTAIEHARRHLRDSVRHLVDRYGADSGRAA